MLEGTRRSPFRLVATLFLCSVVALTALGCGRVIDFGALSIKLPSPAPGLEELARRRRALDDILARLADPERTPSGEIILRLSLTGGWGLPDPASLHLTIGDDGRVIRVSDTSVFSSTQDYTTLRLSRTGVEHVLRMTRSLLPARREDLDRGAGVSPTDRSAWLEIGDAIVLSMDRLGQTEGYDRGQRAWRARFGELIRRLVDLTWLGDHILEPESAWIPPSMTVLAGPVSAPNGHSPGSPFAPWPLDRSIEELAIGTTLDAHGEERLVLCLADEEVVPVFALLTGVNHAYLRVDDGKGWQLDVRPHYPGYRLVGDPCP